MWAPCWDHMAHGVMDHAYQVKGKNIKITLWIILGYENLSLSNYFNLWYLIFNFNNFIKNINLILTVISIQNEINFMFVRY